MTIRDLRLESQGAGSSALAVSVERATLELTLGSLLRDGVHVPTVELRGVVIHPPLLPGAGAGAGTDPEKESSEAGVPLPALVRDILNRLAEAPSTRADKPQQG